LSSFIKPTKLKLVLFLLIWITLWSSIKIEKAVRPIALERFFPKTANYTKDAVQSTLEEYKEEVKKIGKEVSHSIASDPKVVRKTASILLITSLCQALPCYLCSCIIVFLTKNRLTKEMPNNKNQPT
jgi:hypothetical protein